MAKKILSALTAMAMSVLLGITCFAETTVGASSGNTATGVTFDITTIIICVVALVVVVAVGIITAVVSKKKKNNCFHADSWQAMLAICNFYAIKCVKTIVNSQR